MKPYSYKFFAAFALTALGMTLAGCQQPPAAASAAPAATPAPSTTVIEEVHHDDGDARKMQDRRDHPRPDDPDKRDRP
jgi:hypothetical protein